MRNLKENTVRDLIKLGKLDHINLIWKAIMEMDFTFLKDLLVADMTYHDMSKEAFIKTMDFLFGQHKEWGDTEFYLDFDICDFCCPNKPLCKFIGNNSKNTFYLHFETKGKRVRKIYQCYKLDNNDDYPF